MDIDDDDPDDVQHTAVMFCLYEDGDAEDRNEEEFTATINLYMKLESGEINEWEICGDGQLDHSFVCLFIYFMTQCEPPMQFSSQRKRAI